MIRVLNTWKSKVRKLEYYELVEDNLIAKRGDCSAYFQWKGSIIYTYKDIAVLNMNAFNIDVLESIDSEFRPSGEYSSRHFLYDRAMESKERGLTLLKEQ